MPIDIDDHQFIMMIDIKSWILENSLTGRRTVPIPVRGQNRRCI
jgi:hypothetical protein